MLTAPDYRNQLIYRYLVSVKCSTRSHATQKPFISSRSAAPRTRSTPALWRSCWRRLATSLTENAERAGVLIVNTCGFIGPAREELLQVLGELAAHKRKGQLLIAAGCLTQRYGAEVARQVPGIDGILGTRRWMDIVDVVQKLRSRRASRSRSTTCRRPPPSGSDEHGVPRVAVQGGSAYLKIADGCRRPCAFCAIPLIKGTAVSRPVEAILAEARLLQEHGRARADPDRPGYHRLRA